MSGVLRKKGSTMLLVITGIITGILLIPLFLEAAGYRGGQNDNITGNGLWYDSWGGGNGYHGGSNGNYSLTSYWPLTYTPTYTTPTSYTTTIPTSYTTTYEPSLYTTIYTPSCCWGPGLGYQYRWGQQKLSYDYSGINIPASTSGIFSNYMSYPYSFNSVLPYSSSPSSSYNYNSPWGQYTIGQGSNIFVFGGEVTNNVSQSINLGTSTLPQYTEH